MSENQGLLSLDQLQRLTSEDEIDTVLVVFTDLYGRFMGKRFDADFFLESAAKVSGFEITACASQSRPVFGTAAADTSATRSELIVGLAKTP